MLSKYKNQKYQKSKILKSKIFLEKYILKLKKIEANQTFQRTAKLFRSGLLPNRFLE